MINQSISMSIKPLTLTSYLLAGWFFFHPSSIGKIDGLPCFLAKLCFADGWNDEDKLSTRIHVEFLLLYVFPFQKSNIETFPSIFKKWPKNYYGNMSNLNFFFFKFDLHSFQNIFYLKKTVTMWILVTTFNFL